MLVFIKELVDFFVSKCAIIFNLAVHNRHGNETVIKYKGRFG